MKKITQLALLLIILAVGHGLKAAKYVVSGAGADVNGTYEDSGFTNAGHPFFILDSNSYRALIYDGKWKIASIDCCYGSDGATVRNTYYYTNNSGSNPPSSGWSNSAGALPIPSVKLEQSELLYNTLVFTESPEDDGTIDNTMVITCNNLGGETFTGKSGDDFVADGKVIVSNLPAGMTARILRKDDLTLLAMLTGIPASHNNANDVSNLTFAFQNSAFTGGNAGVVGGSYRNTLKINFIQIFHVGSTGDFTTITAALAACHDGDILNLAAETFTETDLTVSKSITIQGQGAKSTIVQTASSAANANGNVFYASYVNLTIKDLTVRYGNSSLGAGILSDDGSLNLIDLDIYGNTSTSDGIVWGKNIAMSNCSLHDNTGGYGLQICEYGVATVTNSTIAKNVFDAWGGCGIYCDLGSTLHLTNCTVAENTGYGLFAYACTLSAVNNILTDNTKDDYRVQSGDALTDSGFNVVKKQSSSDNSGNWKFNQASDILYNYKADGSSSTQWNRNSPALANQNLNLGSTLSSVGLLNNGPVLPILDNSFMINAGTDAGAPTTDQVGQSRNGTTDIGAFEYGGVSAIVPTVNTTAITTFNTLSATMGGNVSSSGGATVMERGVVYSLSGTPDISDNKVVIGSGTGTFSGSVSGLLRNTTYYVRAFATNTAGTAYGTKVSFTTASGKPVLGNLDGDSGTFTEGDNPLAIDSGGDATLVNGDNSGYNGGNLTVSPIPGYMSASLSISTSGNLVLSGGMNVGSSITIGGTVVGTITSSGYNGTKLVISFNANATDDLIGTLIHHIAYSNNSEESLGVCSVHFTIQNANAIVSSDAIVTINTFVVNDPPTLTAVGINPTFTAGDPTVTLFSNAAASTVEIGQTFTGLTLTVSNVSDGSSERLYLDGSTISLTNGVTGTSSGKSLAYSVSVTGSTATLTLSGGSLSAADLQSLVNSMGYQNNSDNPTEPNRVVIITLLKDNGGTLNGGDDTAELAVTSTVTVKSGKPVLTNLNGDSGSFKEGDNPLLIDNGGNATVSNHADSGYNGGNLSVAIASASASESLSIKTSANVVLGTGMAAGSTVSVGGTVIGSIATAKDGQTGHDLVITFNADATDALISTLIQNVTYSNNSEVDLGSRSVSVTILNANSFTSVASIITINTLVVNDPPTLTITGTYPTFTEHSPPVKLYSGATASTWESGQLFSGFSLTVTNLPDGASEQLVIDGSNVVLTGGTSGTTVTNHLTYNVSVSVVEGKTVAAVVVTGGSLSEANLETVLNNLSYFNSSDSPSSAQYRLVRITGLSDNGGTANGGINTTSLFIPSFVTVVATNLPTVNTTSITTYGGVSATMGGNVTADGGATVTERGVVYSASDTTPTIGETGVTKDVNGTTGTGSFSKSITGLSGATTYYVQAYATNAEGTAYGGIQSFTSNSLPTISTTAVTTFNSTSATMGGNVTADGGATVTERGVVYSSSDNTPTIGEAGVIKDVNGTAGTGSFSKSITGLSNGTTYYVQAYATSSAGTTYGSMQSFATTSAPVVTTTAIATFNSTSATMGGNVTADGGAAVTERGVVYSTSDSTPTIGEAGVTKVVNGTTGTGTFTNSVTGLSSGTAYYVRAYATNSVGTIYGSTQSFTTTAPAAVSTTAVTTFNSTSATMGGNVTADGGATVTERGVVYSTSDTTPTIGETGVTQDVNGTTGTGTFSKSVTGLSGGTTYYVRAYATNSVGTTYGSTQSFTTTALPTVSTTAITTFNGNSATMGGNVTADGGATVTERGVVYSASDNTPTIGETGVTKDVNGTSGTGTFSKSVTGLSRGTTYFVRAYATNSEGASYGSMQSFTTTATPTVTTTAITTYDASSATLGGNVTADGGTTVTERGVVYSSSDNTPTIGEADVTKEVNGTAGTGAFSKSVTGLSGGTTYYVRAYAINSEGTTYGSMQSFTTIAAPTITTTAVTNFNSTSATMGGNVTSDGGASVTQRGVVYSSYDNNPTMGRPGVLKDVSGTTGTGIFSKSISGLSNGTTYYVRAYVINSQGTVYGSVQSFTTTAPPIVSTNNITTFNNTSATLGGNVNADGGAAVTERGVVYSSSDNTPTIGEADVFRDANGTNGTGTFSKSVTGLTNGTTYYVRAYATNSEGTSYGSTQSFTTTAPPTVSTSAVTSYNSSSAMLEGNVTANGGADVTERGFVYSSSDNTPLMGESGVAKDVSGSIGMGIFTNSVTGLSTGITYYVRAYATNDLGTAYGSVQSFSAIGPPTVTTTAITTFNSTSATMGGNVTANGGAAVTERGVVYSTSDNTPTIGEAGVMQDVNGTTGTGTFSKSITGLSSGTTYYVVAYATNSQGTAYGSVGSFATPLGKPSVSTTGSASVTAVSADVSGNITAVGSGNATVRGVCYNTTGTPDVNDPKSETTGNYGTGDFTSSLTGLSASTTYYARAYATNSGGTGYGDQVSFTTLAIPANPTSITATYTTLCNGASTQLTANGPAGTVSWYTGSCDGTLLTTGNPVTVTPLAGTTYYARNFNNGAYSVGCASIDIFVQPRPTVADLKATGTGIKWYLTQTGGTALPLSTPLINGQHYWASQTLNGQESIVRLDVLVNMTNP